MKKVCVITERRAEYGILRPVLTSIEKHPKLDLSLIVTGTHLSEDFGYTLNEIKKDGFKINASFHIPMKDDSGAGVCRFLSRCFLGIADALEKIKPDILLIGFDTPAYLAAAVAGIYMNIAIAHIHGGDVSGNVDEQIRHAITKLSHIHFAATKQSAERIIKMGEESWRVFVVGAPGLDTILNEKLVPPTELSKKYKLDLSKPILLVVQHSVVTEVREAQNQILETLKAIERLKHQTILIYPNADPGGRKMISIIEKFKNHPFIKVYKSIPHKDYLGLMKIVSVMIGNSSSGIIEAPSFNLPVVNIGTRQQGRERAENIIDVGYDEIEIENAIKKALTKEFREKTKNCKNPYGDGRAAERIVNVLDKIKINNKLLQKKLSY